MACKKAIFFMFACIAMLPNPLFSEQILEHAEIPVTENSENAIKDERLWNEQRLLLLSLDIDLATDTELDRLLVRYGLSFAGSPEEKRRLLREHLGIPLHEATSVMVESAAAEWNLQVLHAQSLFMDGLGEKTILLVGDVLISLSIGDGGEKRLQAERVIISIDGKCISAVGAVTFAGGGDTVVEGIAGEIVSFDWDTGDIIVSKGKTTLVRKNSEEEDVVFEVTGRSVSYAGDGSAVSFQNSKLTTGDQEYVAITTKTLILTDNGDLFADGAVVSIGRVPILYIPILFYPGSTFVFNPSFGYDASKGWFFYSTTELYGRYPKIEKAEESSFTSLLASAAQGDMTADGWVYRLKNEEDEYSDLDLWANESSSYAVLLVDATQCEGMFIGLDTSNSLFDKALLFSVFGGLAIRGEAQADSSLYSIPMIRGLVELSIKIKLESGTFSLEIPWFSDPKVKRNYTNRPTDFSISALWGSMDFPTTVASDTTTYVWNLSTSLSVPAKHLAWSGGLIETLSLKSLKGSMTWKARQSVESSGYYLDQYILPDLQASISGTLFSWEETPGVKASDIMPEDPELSDLNKETKAIDKALSGEIKDLLDDLPGLYTPVLVEKAASASSSLGSADLTYSSTQSIVRKQTGLGTSSVSGSWYLKNSSEVSLSCSPFPSLFSLKMQANPVWTYLDELEKTTSRFSSDATATVSVPALGLSYVLTGRLFSFMDETSQGSIVEEEKTFFSWDSDSIKTHRLLVSRVFSFSQDNNLSLSLTSILPPLNSAVTPKAVWKSGPYGLTLAWKFKDDDNGVLATDVLTGGWSYTDMNNCTFTFEGTCDTQELKYADFIETIHLKASASCFFLQGNGKLSQSIAWDGETGFFQTAQTSVSLPFVASTLLFSGYDGTLDPVSLDTVLSITGAERFLWKNRIRIAPSVKLAYFHHFEDMTATHASATFSLSFQIAEFLSVAFSVTSINTGFYAYTGGFAEILEDLVRSFDFFGTGRYSTRFTMEKASLEIIHFMEDWDLHCKYAGSVVLSDNVWRWKPVFTVYLQWKAVPELKIDQKYEP